MAFFARPSEGNTFYFAHESGKSLRDYQGNGPYSINGNLTTRLSIHPSSSQDPIRLHWVQPLFDYSGDIPRWTGLFRHVNYSFAGRNVNWSAGGNTPYLFATGVAVLASDYLAKRLAQLALLGPAGQIATVGVALYDFGTFADNALTINWDLTVRITNSRNNPIPVTPKRECFTSVICGPR